MDRVSISASYALLGLLVMTCIIWMAIPKSWEEATREKADGTYDLSDAWQEALDTKREKIMDQELYALVASENGMYLCNHCPTGKFFLYAGETFRYGTTGNDESGRGYSENWKRVNKLNYFPIFWGDEASVKIKQAEYIANYVLHPENLRRPLPKDSKAKIYWYRLVLPPGNSKLD